MYKNLLKKALAKCGYELELRRVSKGSNDFKKGVAYIHIAKSGGTSIDSALRNAFAKVNEPRISRDANIKASMSKLNDNNLSRLEQSAAFGDLHLETIKTVLSYHMGFDRAYVSGHVAIDSNIVRTYSDRYDFLTVVRDPVQRLISHYVYAKLTNELPIMLPNNIKVDNVINEAKDILESKRGWQMAHTTTMCLGGFFPENYADAVDSHKRVLNNLKQFKVVGFLDDLSSFEQNVYHFSGVKPNVQKLNTTQKMSDRSEHNASVESILRDFFEQPKTKILVERLCKAEIQLYQKIEDQFRR